MLADYVYNALGQRSRKTTATDDTVYLYDLSGQLLAEYDASGSHLRDYVWMDGAPVAVIEAGEAVSVALTAGFPAAVSGS